MARHRAHRGWHRRQKAAFSPEELHAEIERRVLSDLEHCRVAWQEADDPLALCVAVEYVEMPEWLRDSLIVLLTDAGFPKPTLWRKFPKLWKAHARDMADRTRAGLVAALRAKTPDADITPLIAKCLRLRAALTNSDNPTAVAERLDPQPPGPWPWDLCAEISEEWTHIMYDDCPAVDPETLQKTVRRVSRQLANPGRYHRAPKGFQARWLAALERFCDRLEARLNQKM